MRVEEEWEEVVYFFAAGGGDLTLFESHAWVMLVFNYVRVKRRCTSPSRSPSPVVAQLGTTNQILSFSVDSLRASVTSCGFIAVKY